MGVLNRLQTILALEFKRYCKPKGSDMIYIYIDYETKQSSLNKNSKTYQV